MKKILIIGKKSFIGSNLRNYLNKYFNVKIFSLEEILTKPENYFNKFSHVINTSIHSSYIKKKYDKKYDLDIRFINKFKKIKFIYIFLSTRKIYFQKFNIKENSLIHPLDNYAKNKLITEKILNKKVKQNLLILRISNILGKKISRNNRNIHKLFLDNFLNYRKLKKKLSFNNNFKDFITIDQFSLMISKLIKKKITGIFNVSLGEKIYISEIISWLDKDFFSKINFKPATNDSFTLSNKKLIKTIKVSINKTQVKNFCLKFLS